MPLEQPVMSATGLFMQWSFLSLFCLYFVFIVGDSALELRANALRMVLQITCPVAAAQPWHGITGLPLLTGLQGLSNLVAACSHPDIQQIGVVTGLNGVELPADVPHRVLGRVVNAYLQGLAEIACLGRMADTDFQLRELPFMPPLPGA